MTFGTKVRDLLGREPTTDELARLQRLQSTLNIQSNDALFSVLIAFESYLQLYGEIPKAIESAALQARKSTNEAARAAVDTSVAKSKLELTVAINEAVRSASFATVAFGRRWMLQGLAAVLVSLAVVGGIGWFVGKDAGRAEALGEARAAVVWAETPEGRAAKAMSDSGELGPILRCDRPGWLISDLPRGERTKGLTRRCSPHADKKVVYGWLLGEP